MKKIIYISLFLIGFLTQAQTLFPTDYSKFQRISSSLSSGQIVIFGDSYTEGSGASSTEKRWSTIFCKYFDATEVNEGDAGATLEKRTPIDYMRAENMVDRVSEIPTKTFSQKMLVFAYGLNDMGQTAPDYNTVNYAMDYQTVLDDAFSKGWLPEQILLISPYYISSAGYTAYAGITKNPAPTETRHLDFIQATEEIAESNNLMYINIYQMQKKNNTSLLDVDNIHPNDAGHLYIAKAIYSYF